MEQSQLNNETGIATRGSEDVRTIISSERGENVSIISCYSPEGRFLPSELTFKGMLGKKFDYDLPAGSKIFMNLEYSYTNSELFDKRVKKLN